MEIDREEVLLLLSSLGIELPKNSKLPDDVLQKRLTKALDCTQYGFDLKTMDPTTLKPWSTFTDKAVLQAASMVSMKEARENVAHISLTGEQRETVLYVNPFQDLRQSVMALGYNWDAGVSTGIIQNKEKMHGILFRVSTNNDL